LEIGGVSRVAVVVVSFNTRDLLARCLESVLAQNPRQVVVVDNGSTDDTVDMVRRAFPQVALQANSTNLGYGAAANQGVAHCGGEYVLLLNGDAILTPGAVAALVARMDAHPQAAVVGPLLRRPDGSVERSYFPFPGTVAWLVENEPLVWLLRCLPPIGRQHFLCFTPPNRDRVVPWVKGAAVLLRRTAFEQAGGFDESYFMFFEEVDLCLRLGAANQQVHFTPSATVFHVGGVSTSQRRTEMAVAHFRSTVRFYRRHSSTAQCYFWLSAMRLKMGMRLARDSARLLMAADRQRRKVLAEQVAAWKISLFARSSAQELLIESAGARSGDGADVGPARELLLRSVAAHQDDLASAPSRTGGDIRDA
jgi:GT2 family glycosyltransferase